ncbi:PQQ-dependent sugar dehydrogenase [Caldibacillus debilis]|uniref:PQQ-dependent sugar dehydrogenase n=1 Tax=Caldibacillus debilis TaxID=301148 RepID=UPI0003682DA3|nr:sorbosone dehydrogenase family protein [Caldibacillus debilis]
MKKFLLFLLFFPLMALNGCAGEKETEPKPSERPPQTEEENDMEVIAKNLRTPWSIEFDGSSFYLSERTGAIVKIAGGKMTRQKLRLEKELSSAAEAGVLGFVLHPEKKDAAFLYYTYEEGTNRYNRVVELRLEKDEWSEEKVLIDRLPSGPVHHGGRMKNGPDKKLYVTAGDAGQPANAQDLDSLGGKILRMNLDGTIPDDNPFPGSYVYSYGHRNPQGLAWDENGQLYSTEHGQSAHDEINEIEPGQNYGWPIIQGDETKEGMLPPLFHTGEDTWAPSGIAYKDGMLYVAQLRGEGVIAFDRTKKTFLKIVSGVGRVRDVYILDNDLYLITNNTDGRGTPAEEDDKMYKIPLPQLR